MVWFRVDDRLPDHHKVRKAGTAAMGLWVLAGAWAAGNLTDGWVPLEVARRYGTKRQADRLEEAGLWISGERAGEPGWHFHEWTEHQPTREMVEKRRQNATERQARWRKSHEEPAGSKPASRVDKGVGHAVNNAAPVPTRPEPKNTPTADPPVTTDHARGVSGSNSANAYRLVDRTLGRDLTSTTRTALAIEVAALLPEVDEPTLTAGLERWNQRTGIGPRILPGLVDDIRKEARGATTQPARTASTDARPSTTDQRVAAVQALKARLATNGTNVLQLPSGEPR